MTLTLPLESINSPAHDITSIDRRTEFNACTTRSIQSIIDDINGITAAVASSHHFTRLTTRL